MAHLLLSASLVPPMPSFFTAEPPELVQVFLNQNLELLGSVSCLAHVTYHIHREMGRGIFLRSACWLCLD